MPAARALAWVRGLRGDFADMGARAEAVADSAEGAGDRFVTMQCLTAMGYSALFRGRFDDAESALLRAALIAREDQKVYRLAMVLGTRAMGVALEGRAPQALALVEEAKVTQPGVPGERPRRLVGGRRRGPGRRRRGARGG